MKILIVKLSALGDQIHLSPAVSDIREAYPDAEIHWTVQPEFADIPALHGAVNHVHALQLKEFRRSVFSVTSWRAVLSALAKLRQTRFDYAIDAQGVLKSALIARLSGARRIIGFSRAKVSETGANWFYSSTWDAPAGLSAVERNRGLVSHGLGLATPRANNYGLTRLPLRSSTSASNIFLVPCASTAEKGWPRDHWLALIARLDQQAGEVNLIWGTEAERSFCREIAEQSKDRAQPLPSRQSVGELAACLQSARLIVGVDSGITHLANAVGAPTVMIFTKTFPHLFFCQGHPLSAALGGFNQPPSAQEVIEASARILDR